MKRRSAFLSLVIAALAALAGCAAASHDPPLTPIASLDLNRYGGRWFELAKYPNRFQTQCVADTTARYDLLPDGAVRVTNRCQVADGSFDEAVGRAERTGEGSEAKLKVRFAPRWLSWLPMVWGDYWVIDLDPDYTLAAVSEPERRYLWILSRTPSVEPGRFQALLTRLQGQGFDTGKLEMTRQDGQSPAK